MEGYLSKKGRMIGSRVKRYMKLEGTTLSNRHSPDGEATWQISVMDAVITSVVPKKKLIIELYNAKMELYCDSKKECEQWIEAFTNARNSNKLVKAERDGNKENNAGKAPVSSSKEPKDKEGTDVSGTGSNFKKSFKVIQPSIRQASADSSDSDSGGEEAERDCAHQPKNGHKIYEETPNSMIFKQFNFKA